MINDNPIITALMGHNRTIWQTKEARKMSEVLDFGKALAQKRNAKRLTRSQVGRRSGMDDSTIGRYEHGNRRVTPETAVALSRALNEPELLYTFCHGCPVCQELRKTRGGDVA